MKPALIEFLLCGTIGTYCVMRCLAVAPQAFAAAREVVAMAFDRRRQQDALIEGGQE